jgi:tryptophanyl-tRNA synthetase
VARVFSGVQPSGAPHLGNYLGAWSRWAREQGEGHYYCIVDLHAMTVPYEPEVLRERTVDTACWLLACGLDPDVCTLFVQSHVREHSECTWVLNCVASMGELQRMVQFKEKSEGKEFVSVGLFAYPVLQAADILLYHAEEVPVGEDQRQHLELARTLARRFNHLYGETFVVPEVMIPRTGARIMALDEPTAKMSKSRPTPGGYISLLDEPDDIRRKIRRAKTDSGTEVTASPDKPAISNLLGIYAGLSDRTISEVEEQYRGKGYGDFKKDLAEVVVEGLSPIRKRTLELLDNPKELDALLESGAEKARAVARPILRDAASRMGLDYRKIPRKPKSWEGGVTMGAQYVVDETGERVSVILPIEEYERLIEELEELEDVLATQAYDEAKAELERGEDEVIPWEQAKKEIEEERTRRGHQDAV